MSERVRKIALERINKLLRLAELTFSFSQDLANRYVKLALRLAMRCNVKLPIEWRRRICPSCGTILKPGINCRIRIRNNRFPHVVITCLNCGEKMRYPIERKT